MKDDVTDWEMNNFLMKTKNFVDIETIANNYSFCEFKEGKCRVWIL